MSENVQLDLERVIERVVVACLDGQVPTLQLDGQMRDDLVPQTQHANRRRFCLTGRRSIPSGEDAEFPVDQAQVVASRQADICRARGILGTRRAAVRQGRQEDRRGEEDTSCAPHWSKLLRGWRSNEPVARLVMTRGPCDQKAILPSIGKVARPREGKAGTRVSRGNDGLSKGGCPKRAGPGTFPGLIRGRHIVIFLQLQRR
jgi:hypothetical protein